MTVADGRTITVAVLTYRRPAALAEALLGIIEQVDQVPESRLLVIDNDQEPSAERVVAAVTAEHPRVFYVHEPRPGIATARNRAMIECGAQDLLVFIDDDERPAERWLIGLVSTWDRYRAPAVVGPVVSTFPGPLDPWITAGGFFNRARRPTGTLVGTAATNNLLLDLAQIRPLSLAFDESFGLSGGSDTVFTRQLVAKGGRIVWCDEALVFDAVPSDRTTRRWVTARVARMGNSDARAAVYLADRGPGRALARVAQTVRGCVRVAAGLGRMVYGRVIRSITHDARGTRTMLRGAGIIRGAWGSVVYEYRRS
ncbi:Glycosyltransferase, GT2 family [Nocardioides terrae]|uniref:Glycosyltransferase, GT2 family n=1 Tax=Nocardioides terrae TaxID=574651 RepID=A0A1I1HTX3_9ACTN|nr:glycosyltransferase [Nocardioides terrae]SFC27374.1 Glycosyltransferase, GT2 family [Nocardioides terrae]